MQIKKLLFLSGIIVLSNMSYATDYTKYTASSAEKPLRIANIADLEKAAEKNMADKGAFDYIAGGVDNEITLRENVSAFDSKKIVPRILRNIDSVDTSTTFLGVKLKSPIIIAPVAAHTFLHVDGEVATAKGTEKAGVMYTLSTYTTKTIDEVVKATPNTPWMFQIYMSNDQNFNKFVLDKAKQAGAKGIIFTADIVTSGNRERNIRNKFKMGVIPMPLVDEYARSVSKTQGELHGDKKVNLSPDDIKWIKETSGLPVYVKGVQDPEDAEIAIQAGADGIWVSNHGGRQLGGAPAAFDTLPAIAKVVNKRVPIVFDSGIREGTHIFKALASGADIVSIGRPVLYALNLGGSEGVNSVLKKFNRELVIAMFSTGAKTIEDVKNTPLVDAK